ncbi:hypothetical protein EMCRGX_G018485 [Ephydatia muelleri]|eukprot:Em0012g856a
MSSDGSSATNVCIKRLSREVEDMATNPPPGCRASPKADNMFEWTGYIDGPPDSVYAGGRFLLDIKIPTDYPFSPPKVLFKTRVYHCNINSQGVVCLDILKDKWTPALNIGGLLLSLASLLSSCNPNDPLVGSIAHQYLNDRNKHDEIARTWTQRYAK